MKRIAFILISFMTSLCVHSQNENAYKFILTEGALQIDTFAIKQLEVKTYDKYKSVHITFDVVGLNKDKAINSILTYGITPIQSSEVQISSDRCYYLVDIEPLMQVSSKVGFRAKKDWQPFSFKEMKTSVLIPLNGLKEGRKDKIIFKIFKGNNKDIFVELPDNDGIIEIK